MFVERSKKGWVAHAPAKINLALEVLGRQPDGYHQVETLLVPVRLFDSLSFMPTDQPLAISLDATRTGADLSLQGDSALQDDPGQNLVIKAIHLLAQYSGHPATGLARLVKRIPTQAGLGGGSSDAAAALVLANRAWGLGYDRATLASLAAQLGADVPFFLHRGAALGAGRGEQISPAPIPAGLPIVIVKPPVGLSTPSVFEALNLERGQTLTNTTGRCTRLVQAIARREPKIAWKHWMKNCLQPAAATMCEWIARMAAAMNKLPVLCHQMSGSGSSYFGLCRTHNEARRVAARLRQQPFQAVFATSTCM